MSARLELFVACLPGLEELVAAECVELGATPPTVEIGRGGVAIEGDVAAFARLLVGTACSSHVLVRLANFHARHFGELCRRAAAVDWTHWLGPTVPWQVHATARRSKLIHTGAIAERIATVVAERIGTAEEAAREAVTVHVRMQDDRCTLSLDVAGRPLHERGWRLATAKAPLREDLAAALLRAAAWSGDRAFCDPMCGSGTIAIEAALRARRIPPGAERKLAGEDLPLLRGEVDTARRALLARALDAAPRAIHASDRDAGAVESARANARRAGVEDDIAFAEAPLSAAPGLQDPGAEGLVACNPPFGRRIGSVERLVPLWQSLGHRVRALGAGWRLAVISADRRTSLRCGLPLRSAFLTDHGGIRVRALVSEVQDGVVATA